jgi:hypothetical protein
MDNSTKIANNHYHPPKPILGWKVELNGRVIFENNSVKICQQFKKVHAFKKALIKSIR